MRRANSGRAERRTHKERDTVMYQRDSRGSVDEQEARQTMLVELRAISAKVATEGQGRKTPSSHTRYIEFPNESVYHLVSNVSIDRPGCQIHALSPYCWSEEMLLQNVIAGG